MILKFNTKIKSTTQKRASANRVFREKRETLTDGKVNVKHFNGLSLAEILESVWGLSWVDPLAYFFLPVFLKSIIKLFLHRPNQGTRNENVP